MRWPFGKHADPSLALAHHRQGVEHLRGGRSDQAVAEFERAVRLDPANADFLKDLGNAQRAAGRLDEALASYRLCLDLAPDNLAALYNVALTLRERGQLAEAEAQFRRVHEIDSGDVDALFHLAAVLFERKQFPESLQMYREAVALAPDNPYLWLGLGSAYQANPGQLDESLRCLEKCVELQPDFADAHCRIGLVLSQLGRPSEAVAAYRRALELDPGSVDARNGLGNILQGEGRLQEAMALYKAALELSPDSASAHLNLGNALLRNNRLDAAAESYRAVIQLDPSFAEAHYNLGGVYSVQDKRDEAISCFEAALRLQPTNGPFALSLLSEMQSVCDWSRFEELYALGRRAALQQPVNPFPFLAMPSTSEEQLQCAKNYAQRLSSTAGRDRLRLSFQSGGRSRLKVGYLSADFHEHATAYLMAELFELHDRSRVEVVGYSYGPDDGSLMRARLQRAFDQLVDIAPLSYAAAAERIHNDQIDILVDLKGYSGFSRPEIMALRPAPIQVNYLGYPGTMAGDFIDYIVVDRFIVPPENARHYAERLVHLPDTYQVNDRKRVVGPAPPREELGLPQDAFVFCSFNQAYKIAPAVFGTWLRLLEAVPASVLWLLEGNRWAIENLRREMARHGIAPERLVGAPSLPLSRHLGRLQVADLAVDTLPYNGHTTTSDALWAGVPVLTCAGDTFASRVAGSLLRAVGLPELVTHSLQEYEALALRLARNPGQLRAVRDKLAHNRETAALFDAPAFARNLEAAYWKMWDNHLHGGPRDIAV